MAKSRIVIAGYFGFGNLGDEVLLHVVLGWLKQFSNVAPCVLSGNPEQTRQQFGVAAVMRTNLASLVCTLWGAKALVFGGGGILQDKTSRRSLFYYLSLIRLARLFKVPVLMIGQGLGPLNGPRQTHTAEALRQVHYVGVRDQKSLDMLRGWRISNIFLGADLVFSLTPPERSVIDTHGPLLGLALVPPPPAHYDTILKRLTKAVQSVKAEHGLTPIFLASSPQDLQFGMALSQRINSLTVLPINQDTPAHHLTLFSEFNVIWGSRLHALILATMVGVPFVGLGYDPKVSQFVKRINEHLVQPMPCWPPQTVNDRELVETTGVLLKGFHNFGQDLRQAAKIERQAANAALTDAGHQLTRLLGLRPDAADSKLKEKLSKR